MKGRKPAPPVSAAAPPMFEPPLPLVGHAAAEWDRIIAILSAKRILSAEDLASLYVYATSYGEYVDAQAQVQAHGSIIMSTTGTPVRNPYCVVASKAWDRIRPLLSEFGLTPSSRGRAGIRPPEDDAEDFF